MATPHPLLSLNNISRHYKTGETTVHALADVSLDIYAGEFVAIMGQSGSGKTTLMNILGCLDRASGGTYLVNGQDSTHLDSDALATLRRETFGFVFQRYNLLPTASAAENVEIPAFYAGMNAAERLPRAQHLLASLGLGDRAEHRPNELSGGQQQRVAIARALMNDPPVILADEPTGALDSQSGKDVMALLADLHTQGRTVILITHDENVARHAKRIIRIKDGRIVSDDSQTENAIASAVTPFTGMQSAKNASITSESGEAVRTALRALNANMFRTALTLLGIVIGVAAVIIMMAIGNGSKQKVLDQISSLGTNILNIRPGAAGVRNSGDNATLSAADALSLIDIPNVSVVVPERSGRKTIRYGNTDYATQIQGVGAGFPIARDWQTSAGTFFSDQDVESYAALVVLGATVANTLFPDHADPIGKYVLAGNIPFLVIGVMDSKGAAPWGGDQDDAVFVPYTTGMARLFGGTYINSITLKVADADQIPDTEQAVIDKLTARHGSEDFSVRNTASFLEMATSTQNTLTILLGAVAAISLLVGGIGVMNIMLVSVTERTREIGIRMATGARQRDIMLQFNTEAAVVCTIGGLTGLALGFGGGFLISLFGVDVMFSAGPAIIAFASAVLTGLLFGYLPARKAARLDPVIALASE